MKTINLLLVFLFSFMFFFFMLSFVGCLWASYKTVISCPNWFIIYSLFFGWWMAAAPTIEYYSRHENSFKQIFA